MYNFTFGVVLVSFLCGVLFTMLVVYYQDLDPREFRYIARRESVQSELVSYDRANILCSNGASFDIIKNIKEN